MRMAFLHCNYLCMEENKKIKLNLGEVSLAEELGVYYIDMRPALIHYTNNIYDGRFDDNGVPMINTKSGLVYSPINIAQYGFMIHADYYENRENEQLEILMSCLNVLEITKTERENYCVWYHNWTNEKYDLSVPWASAMAQGEVISFYLRMYQLIKDKKLLETAIKAYNFLKIDVSQGGVRRFDEDGNLWFEEYPTKEALLVLNGFIYTIFGLYDLFRVTKLSEIKDTIDCCISTLKNTLNKFDAGFWSFYDMQKKELVRYYYQKNVHVPQMEILYILTRNKLFLKYKNKWESQLTPINYFIVQILYRVKYRIPQLYNIIISLWKK